MDNILEVKNVVKVYGNKRVIDNVSFNVPKGEVFGMLGPNGAGKTTMIRMINQITLPDSGEILFNNKPLCREDVKKVGYLPEERGLYKKMKVGEVALYLAQLKGISEKDAKERLKHWFEKFSISDWWNKKVEELSKGMQQKVQFITTVLHEPELLIFDEPFSGFDPLNTELLKQEIMQMKSQGATIIFSTHNMASVEEICDKIVLINQSKNILEGDVKKIKQQFKTNEYELVTNQEIDNLMVEGTEIIDQQTIESNFIKSKVRISKGRHADLLSNILKTTEIISYKEILPTMNDIFIQTVKSNK